MSDDPQEVVVMPGDVPITLADIAKRIEALKDIITGGNAVITASVTCLEERVRSLETAVSEYKAAVDVLQKKLKDCPRANPNGGSCAPLGDTQG
jgi:tetrahydromethanopterin S-methyltransferase subunit B